MDATIEQAWTDFDSLLSLVRDDVQKYESQRPTCPTCQRGSVTSTRDGCVVCVCCGTVLDSRVLEQVRTKFWETCTRKSSDYRPVFHWHERLAQLNCLDPDLPMEVEDAIDAVWQEKRQFFSEQLTQFEVKSLLDLVTVWLKDNRNIEIDVRKKYQERWIRIRFELTGQRPPPLTVDVITYLEHQFLTVVSVFQRLLRGDEDFCRHNLPNYNFMFQQFFRHLMATKPEEFGWVEQYLWYLPTLRTRSRIQHLEAMWIKLRPFTFLPVYPVPAYVTEVCLGDKRNSVLK